MSYPQIFRVRQTFAAPCIEDVVATTHSELSRLHLIDRIGPNQQVAITAGSRGITNIHLIIKAVVEHLKSLGAQPFIVPAMGSHGGATAQGQRELIESYGITEKFCGCPIRSSMETTVICHAPEGFPVHFDKNALAADHLVVINRVKPHTGFVGDIESGLMKMMLIGLGNHAGAKIYHQAIINYSFGQIVHSVAREVLSRCRVVCGLAVVENAYDQTALIRAVEPQEFEDRERELLILAKQWMPRLPFSTADILIVDEIGKNISGTGMDTNAIGRKYNDRVARSDEWPKCLRIVVRGLSKATHGNANGIGIAEFCLTRAIEQMDYQSTRLNSLTAGHPTAAMLPLDYPTDRECLDAALSTIGLVKPEDARLMWIHNTLDIAEVECSISYLPEVESRHDLEVIVPARSLPLDSQGNLPDRNWS